VADPCIVAPRVDGVVLAVRISKDSRPQSLRAKQLLAEIDANVLGVVVNCCDAGTHYGRYGYGDRYGSSVGYGYGYTDGYTEDKVNNKYYEEPDAKDRRPQKAQSI
jgi:polysaccharide biosynthesis transport protein